MILLDPDLGPSTQPGRRRAAAQSPTARSLDSDRIPSVRSLSQFLSRAQAAVRLRGQVSVLLTGDAQIQRLNRQFRGKNKATDVLSFPAEPGPEKLAGDLAISVLTARKQAAQQGHPLSTEIKILMLHGLLHLAGYDHETDTGQMARREQKLRAELRLPLGLIERAAGPTLSPGKRRKAGPSTRSLRELAQDDKTVGRKDKALAQDDKAVGRRDKALAQDDRTREKSRPGAGRGRKP